MYYLETVMYVLKLCVAVGTRSRGRVATRTISVPHVRPDIEPLALADCVDALGALIDAPILRYRVSRRVRRRDAAWMLASRARMLARLMADRRALFPIFIVRYAAACVASALTVRPVARRQTSMYHIDSS